MSFQEHEVYPLYAALWGEAQPAIARNEVAIDAHLSDREHDSRRGLTVLARPSPEVRLNIARFLEQMRALEPGQYYARPDELHVTVLALFTATDEYRPFFDRIDAYRGAVREALRGARGFAVTFAGVTASKGVVMAQGFPQGDALGDIRARLREALSRAGLRPDERYRVRAAHVSAARFAAPLQDPQRTSEFLAAHRETVFGTTDVRRLDLVANDWYLSRDRVSLLDAYPLSPPPGSPRGAHP